MQRMANQVSYVAYALVHAASRLISTPVVIAKHRHECRRGTPGACATKWNPDSNGGDR